jgi:hypothetical protein
MPSAQSPRDPAPKLRSTHVVDGTAPRKTQTVYQAVALGRGYTVKAGATTRARLYRGIPRTKSNETSSANSATIESTPHKATS